MSIRRSSKIALCGSTKPFTKNTANLLGDLLRHVRRFFCVRCLGFKVLDHEPHDLHGTADVRTVLRQVRHCGVDLATVWSCPTLVHAKLQQQRHNSRTLCA